jgi:tRNA pseudouridine32 synthase/23S rRNA pseudouridine746 synthase
MTRPPHRFKPPMRDGVSASCVALPSGPWELLADFLAERLPAVSHAEWRSRMTEGRVLDEDGRPLPPDAPFRPQTRVYYYRELAAEPVVPFEETVLFQDEHLLVADKPHFLPVTPGGRFVQQTLLVRLKQRTGIETLSPIHRIDRETAGLVVFSIRPQDRGAYQALLREQRMEKEYEAIAPWREGLALPRLHRSRMEPDTQFFRQREVAGEPNSETCIELLETHGSLARYRLLPRSGRMHQLRVHMNALGLPIVGDRYYPEILHRQEELATEDYANPLRLLARAIAFTDPVTGEARRFVSARNLDLR